MNSFSSSLGVKFESYGFPSLNIVDLPPPPPPLFFKKDLNQDSFFSGYCSKGELAVEETVLSKKFLACSFLRWCLCDF